MLLLIAILPSMNGSSYGLDPNSIFRTGIQGGSSSQPNLTVQCSNSPLSPHAEQKVNITATALSGPTQTEVSVDYIDIFSSNNNNNMTVPVARISNTSTLGYTFRASTDSPFVTYSCRVVDNGISVFSDWKRMRVETRAVPISYNNASNINLDIVYIADKDSYSGSTDPNFLADVEKANQIFNNERMFSINKDKINFWAAQDMGDARGRCIVESPANWDSAYSFAEVGIVLHRDNSIRDCALLGAEELFTANMADTSARANITLLHEIGRRPFGLADEYNPQMLDGRRIQWWFDCLRNENNYTNCNNVSDTGKSIVVRLNFTDLNVAELLSANVSFGGAHANIGNPPLLKVEAFDDSGNQIQNFSYWHPLWAFQMEGDGHEALTILPKSEGRIVTAFDRRIAEMRVSYIYSEDGEAVEGDEVISIDLRPTIRAFCEEFPEDPSCQCPPGQVPDDDGKCVESSPSSPPLSPAPSSPPLSSSPAPSSPPLSSSPAPSSPPTSSSPAPSSPPTSSSPCPDGQIPDDGCVDPEPSDSSSDDDSASSSDSSSDDDSASSSDSSSDDDSASSSDSSSDDDSASSSD
jgi:hypothetical protein